MRDVARGFTARGDGHGAVGLFEGEDVVDAVARHGDGIALFFDGAHEDRLLFGGDAAEDGVLARDVFHFQFGEAVEGDVLVGVAHAHAPCDFGHGDGVIARDDLDVHVVFAEPFDGVEGIGADVIGEGDDRGGAEEAGEFSSRDGGRRVGEQKHAQACGRILFDDLVDLGGHGAQDEFGRAHGEGACFAEGHGGELPLAGKGDGRARLESGGVSEAVVEGDGRLIVVVEGGEHAAHDFLEGVVDEVVEDHDVVDGHASVGDGAGLIEAEHVDAGEHFQGIEVLDERLLFGEAHDADRHGEGGEQEKAGGDHADDDGARELDGEAEVGAGCLPVDEEHGGGDEGNENADDADEEADGVHDLRARFFVLARLGGEGVEVRRLADFVGAGAAGAACDVGAGVECFAGRLFDGDGLAGQEGLVDFRDAVQEDAVGGDLLSRFEQDDVVEDDVAHADLDAYAVAHDLGGRRDEHGEAVDLFFGEDLLNDPDEEVCREDGDEEELRKRRARIDEGERHDEAEEVEEGADIAYEDARVGLGVLFVDVVEEKLRKAQLHLFVRESRIGGRVEAFHVLGGRDVFGAAELFEQFFSVELPLGRGTALEHAIGKAFFGFAFLRLFFGGRFVGRSVQAGNPPFRVFARDPRAFYYTPYALKCQK